MRSPFSPTQFLFFVFLLGLLLVFIQIQVLVIAFEKLGLSQTSAFFLLFASLFGSMINLPLFTTTAEPPPVTMVPKPMRTMLRPHFTEFQGKTIIAVNVGGCLIPTGFSLYLLYRHPLGLGDPLLAITAVAMLSRLLSRPIPGMGIGMPILVAPFAAAIVSIVINPDFSAPLAYISGTLGVLIGADMLRLGDIRKMGTPFASIGGAGTFDGIFLTGIVAVLLA